MNVLLIGSGGREHAIARQIHLSVKLNNLYISPGNPGTAKYGKNTILNISDHQSVINFCKDNSINLVVVGPEQPLIEGLADSLIENSIKVFGPNKEAAKIEGDKSFAKEVMQKANVPTGEYKKFNKINKEEALNYLETISYPTVIKAIGLAAGKGVLICNNYKEASEAVSNCFEKRIFGESGDSIIIEEFLTGQEASVFAICDGKDFVTLPVSQDHKRIFDGDNGKNTGGMGAYAPAPIVNDKLLTEIETRIIQPVLDTLASEGKKYTGCLYAGLILTEAGPKVIEFNCRFGDPETQVVLPILEGDFLELLYSSASGNVSKNSVSYKGKSAVCVVASSKGYPDEYKKGFEISGIEKAEKSGAIVFHAGTKFEDGKLLTNGGRVLGVTAVVNNNDLKLCKEKAYEFISKINFEGMYFRKDISDKAFQ
jgi:phosphoribosylamine--glycine ligase